MRAFYLTAILIALSACAPKHKSVPRGATYATPENRPEFLVVAPPEKVSGDWSPNQVEVSCAADKCPVQVGVILFAGAPKDGMIPIHRCTGFLVGADLVMSNGHCDHVGKERGFFVGQKINGQTPLREITGTTYKRFTPHPKGPIHHTGRPDVVIFKLNQPIAGVRGLPVASGAQAELKQLFIFGIMNGKDQNHLNVEKFVCEVRRHEADFPYNISEAPDVIQSYGCKTELGTSGAPMFAPGSEEVQAVHMGGANPEERAKAAKEELGRELRIYEKHWTSIATNVRCLDLPGRQPISCVKADEAESGRRFLEMQKRALNEMPAKSNAETARFAMKFKQVRYQLKGGDLNFEVIHVPTCRTSSEATPAIHLLIESVKMDFNEWAELRPRSLALNPVLTQSALNSGTSFNVQISWPAPAGEYTAPDKDLRKVWGSRFNIDLPVCSR